MLVIASNCVEHLSKTIEFAQGKSEGHFKQLVSELWYLHTWFRELHQPTEPLEWQGLERFEERDWAPIGWGAVVQKKAITVLSPDFAPASFGFAMYRFDSSTGGYSQYVMSGGLIYTGDQSGWVMRNGQVIPPGHCVETFSVSFGEDPQRFWAVRT